MLLDFKDITPDPMAVRTFRSADGPVKSFIRRFKCLDEI